MTAVPTTRYVKIKSAVKTFALAAVLMADCLIGCAPTPASVDMEGTILAVAKGNTVVTATSGDKTVSVKVTVK